VLFRIRGPLPGAFSLDAIEFVVLTALGALAAAMVPRLEALEAMPKMPRLPRVRPAVRGVAMVGGVIVAVFGTVIGVRVVRDELADGLDGRAEFVVAAWRNFIGRPLFGSGLETFGLQYPQLRPVGIAQRAESLRSTSVHNPVMAMFSSGGVVLGLAYLAFIVTITALALRALHRTRTTTRFIDPPIDPNAVAAVTMGWAAALSLQLISVDSVTVYTAQFVLAGMIGSLTVAMMRASAPARGDTDPPPATAVVTPAFAASVAAVIVAVIVAVTVVVAVVVTVPLRAERADYLASLAQTRGDAEVGLALVDDAVRIAPWVGEYRVRRTEVLNGLGRTGEAADEARRAAPRLGYNWPSHQMADIEVAHAEILARSGDRAGAREHLANAVLVVQRSVDADPHARRLRIDAAQVLARASAVSRRLGDTEVADQTIALALEVIPPFDEVVAVMSGS
jgi:hypothetical protein